MQRHRRGIQLVYVTSLINIQIIFSSECTEKRNANPPRGLKVTHFVNRVTFTLLELESKHMDSQCSMGQTGIGLIEIE